jgi:hypothetical protein
MLKNYLIKELFDVSSAQIISDYYMSTRLSFNLLPPSTVRGILCIKRNDHI